MNSKTKIRIIFILVLSILMLDVAVNISNSKVYIEKNSEYNQNSQNDSELTQKTFALNHDSRIDSVNQNELYIKVFRKNRSFNRLIREYTFIFFNVLNKVWNNIFISRRVIYLDIMLACILIIMFIHKTDGKKKLQAVFS